MSLGSEDIAKQRDDFFRRIQEENANRPDDLPPSQGGRYGGIGNPANDTKKKSATAEEFFDNAWSSMKSGWSSFTTGAQKFASQASEKAHKFGETMNESVFKPTALKATALKDKMKEKMTKLKKTEKSEKGEENRSEDEEDDEEEEENDESERPQSGEAKESKEGKFFDKFQSSMSVFASKVCIYRQRLSDQFMNHFSLSV
jgi:ADP-ribosylation factor GTPase-activating protein 1